MPELPEVETIRSQLEERIVGLRIKAVDVRLPKVFRGYPKEIIGRTVKAVNRRGKLLIIELDDDLALLVHLKLTGQLIFQQPLGLKSVPVTSKNSPLKTLPHKHTHVIFTFENRGQLFFNDLRQFGWIELVKISRLRQGFGGQAKFKGQDYLKNLGPEPFDKEFSLNYFKEILGKWRRPVKLLLLEQKKIAGLGNIYANEALFCARVAPHHRASDLLRDHPEKIEELFHCLQKVLKIGLKYQGASDQYYLTAEGKKGQYQEHFLVYGRVGERCLNNCGGQIRKMTLGGRGTFFCPKCQR